MKNNRCSWAKSENSIAYHDNEWGVPSHNDDYIFEMLILEGFQAGLSWNLILNKRENFRKAFDNFDYKKIAKYNENKLSELVENKGIVRNKLKIVALVENAVAFMEIQKKLDHLTNTSGNLWITNELLIIGKI